MIWSFAAGTSSNVPRFVHVVGPQAAESPVMRPTVPRGRAFAFKLLRLSNAVCSDKAKFQVALGGDRLFSRKVN
jgi:hypothetical protein